MQGRVFYQPNHQHITFWRQSRPCFYQTPRWICKYSFGFRKPQCTCMWRPHMSNLFLCTPDFRFHRLPCFHRKHCVRLNKTSFHQQASTARYPIRMPPPPSHACSLIAGHSPFKEAHQHSQCQTPPRGCYHSTRWFTRCPVRLTSCPLHRMHYHSA